MFRKISKLATLVALALTCLGLWSCQQQGASVTEAPSASSSPKLNQEWRLLAFGAPW